jgi:nucleoside phosphorylase
LRIESALVTGVCGLLSPELVPGDAVIYEETLMGTYDPLRSDPRLSDELRALFPEAYAKARGITVPSVVTSADDKAEIAVRYGANAVDTETFGIVAALGNAGVRTAVMRFGSDSATDVLPDINAAIDASGKIDGGILFREMFRNPLGGARLVLGGSIAITRLARAVERIGRV